MAYAFLLPTVGRSSPVVAAVVVLVVVLNLCLLSGGAVWAFTASLPMIFLDSLTMLRIP